MTKIDETIEDIAAQALREISLDSQNRLEEFFFGPKPLYPEIMSGIKLRTTDRDEQMTILLSIFASKDYNRSLPAWMRFLAEIRAPRIGEQEH